MVGRKTNHLVIDSAGFLKHCSLQDLGNNIYTVPQVVDEIKDAATRQRLQVLSYELKLKDPSIESLNFVTEFSKKSGDYLSLSATDMKVLALTYELEKMMKGTNHLRQEPQQKRLISSKSTASGSIPGFYWPSTENGDDDDEHGGDDGNDADIEEPEKIKDKPLRDSNLSEVCTGDLDESMSSDEKDEPIKSLSSEKKGDTWITPENIEFSKMVISNTNVGDEKEVEVACLTSDFAIQNVLMQIGLNVVSMDGNLIKETRTYILRCFLCYKTTSIMTKIFCPHCGNKTLKRVAVSVSEDGSQIIHISKRPLNIRGTKVSLPMPKGGKHANNPILCEDQRIPQQRMSNLALSKVNALDPDYIARSSPFAVNDVFSRAANLGVNVSRHNQKRNQKARKKK